MKINPSKSKALRLTRARVKDPLNCYFFLGGGVGQRISETNNCKYIGVILRSLISWADQVIYTIQKKPRRHVVS
jgi:hypothetical protein